MLHNGETSVLKNGFQRMKSKMLQMMVRKYSVIGRRKAHTFERRRDTVYEAATVDRRYDQYAARFQQCIENPYKCLGIADVLDRMQAGDRVVLLCERRGKYVLFPKGDARMHIGDQIRSRQPETRTLFFEKEQQIPPAASHVDQGTRIGRQRAERMCNEGEMRDVRMREPVSVCCFEVRCIVRFLVFDGEHSKAMRALRTAVHLHFPIHLINTALLVANRTMHGGEIAIFFPQSQCGRVENVAGR